MLPIRLSLEGDPKFLIRPEVVENLPSNGPKKSGPAQKGTA